MLKLFRRLDEGVNPDLEIGRFLTDRAGFEHSAPWRAGSSCKQGAVADERRSGSCTGSCRTRATRGRTRRPRRAATSRAFCARAAANPDVQIPSPTLFSVAENGPSELAVETMDLYLESARLLGTRTAELHLALASDPRRPGVRARAVTPLYQRSLYQSLRGHREPCPAASLRSLTRRARAPSASSRCSSRSSSGCARSCDVRITGARIRIHGDYHLGQVLWTGRDFVDHRLRGRAGRPLGERRIKRLPLVDVAGMLRSFHYAAHAAARAGQFVEPERAVAIAPWVRLWHVSAAGVFLREYLDTVEGAPFHPKTQEERRVLLDAYVLEKALYEVAYEANNRPDWIAIPLAGIGELLEERG